MLSINHLPITPNIYLFRETPEFIKSINAELEPNESYVLDIPELAQVITLDMNNGEELSSEQQKNRIYDYIFLCFFLGNDFMPHFPAVNIRTGGVDKMVQAYKATIGNTNENLTDGKIIYWKNVRSVKGADPFVRRLNASYCAMVIYSPFYGKINTFNKIIYFDWSFGLGAGFIDAESNRKTVDDTNLKSAYERERYQSIAWKTKVKFHLSENLHLGVEWMQQHYKAPGPNRNGQSASETFKNNQDLIISVGFSY
jgi:outer membrane beta-barrel protein